METAPKLKPCPFCGNPPKLFGKKIREIDGETMRVMPERREWEVVPFCRITCVLGSAFATAYGVHGASGYLTPEAAIRAWNTRADEDGEYKKVVRCMECKYAWMTDDGECKYCDLEKDEYGNMPEAYRPGDWYCADGERKETENV